MRDLLGDPLALARVLRFMAADVVCLQEAPRRPGGGLRIAGLGRATGLRPVVGGRTSGGTAILVGPRTRVESAVALRLPVRHWHTRSRGAALATVSTRGANSTAFTVACVHLPLAPAERLLHARLVRAALEHTVARDSAQRSVGQRAVQGSDVEVSANEGSANEGSVVVAGDFNEPCGGPAWRAFEPLVGDPAPGAGPTFPARDPSGRIDAVLVGSRLETLAYGDGGAIMDDVRRASDHLPVLTVLRSRR